MVNYGIVALLDGMHRAQIEAIWAEFQAKFGVHGVSAVPEPHFSFHVAEDYDFAQVETVLQTITQSITPFRVKTTGLGIFTGAEPVLYIPVLLTPTLLALHQWLWDALTPLAIAPNRYYHADAWKPHITLAHNDLDHDGIAQAVRLLSGRSFAWEIAVNRLAILTSEGKNGNPIAAEFVIRA